MPNEREEDVTYADFNVRKYTTGGAVAGGLVRRFMERCMRYVATLAPAGSTILDVGAGEGTMTAFLAQGLPGRTMMAVEYERESCEQMHLAYPRVSLVRGSAYQLPLGDSSVDVVTSFEVLEHLGDPALALREMARVARRHIVITVPYEPFFRMGNIVRGRYLSRLGNTPGHINHWTAAGLRRLVRTELPAANVQRLFPWLLAEAPPP